MAEGCFQVKSIEDHRTNHSSCNHMIMKIELHKTHPSSILCLENLLFLRILEGMLNIFLNNLILKSLIKAGLSSSS
jgi:hypothetical protein